MQIEKLTHTINLPEGVSVDCSNPNVKVVGPRGELSRHFEHPSIKFKQGENQLQIIGNKLRKKEKALIGTWKAHLSNMVQGVNQGFLYEMKVVFAHFPMKVAVKGNVMTIDNFLGEKATRAPSSSISLVRDGVRLKTISSNPDLIRFLAMGNPIMPKPIKPILLTIHPTPMALISRFIFK